MPNFNKTILIGHLVRKPEIRRTESGTAVANASIAVNHKFKDASGDKKEEVSFVDFVVWGKRAEVFEEYTDKGDPVLIEGRMKQERWENKEGENRTKIVIVVDSFEFLKSRGSVSPQQAEEADESGEVPF